ncbi:hypothetical protein ACGFJ5_10870 [Micromonospora echinaurantiaca]|uniref:hypothetical protein n=1 Tax=Micromonospora echinaurantiaca TaxID=47857 RepID=UPI0037108120
MDEREIVGRVGAASPRPGVRRMQDSWLPPSHGWAVLEPRAQRLLADVLLLLNLADRGQDNAERARRLSRASRAELPPCLTIDLIPPSCRRPVDGFCPPRDCHVERLAL